MGCGSRLGLLNVYHHLKIAKFQYSQLLSMDEKISDEDVGRIVERLMKIKQKSKVG